jgi:hypothetical protein
MKYIMKFSFRNIIKLRENKTVIIINTILCIAFVIYALITFPLNNNNEKFKWRSYPFLKHEDYIFGKISSIKESKGESFIIMDDSSKHWIKNSRNYNYYPCCLHDFIQKRDSITKKMNDDTLFIFRGGKIFYFIIGKFIEGPNMIIK